jgi:hypothetical protein
MPKSDSPIPSSERLTVWSELKGNVSTHVKNLEEEFGKRAEKFYKGQGWL